MVQYSHAFLRLACGAGKQVVLAFAFLFAMPKTQQLAFISK